MGVSPCFAGYSDALRSKRRRQFEFASTVKVLIALAILDAAQRENRYVDSFELSLLWPMITISDNDSATKLWDQLGGGRGLANYIAGIGEPASSPMTDHSGVRAPASPPAWRQSLPVPCLGSLECHHRTLFLTLLEKVRQASGGESRPA